MGLGGDFADAIPEPTEILTGYISAITVGDIVTVTVGGNPNPGKLISAAVNYVPTIGDSVLCLRRGNDLRVIGPSGPPLPATGVVAASPGKTASTLTITVTGIGSVEMPWIAAYTPITVGDKVALLWYGAPTTGLVLGKVGNAYANNPAPPPPPGAPPPPAATGTTVFTATAVGTWRDGGWRSDDNGDAIQGTYPGFGANTGVWFYNGQPRSTLGGATVTSAEIWLGRTSGGTFAAQTVHLYRTADDFKGGAPSLLTGPHDVSLAVDQSGWFGLSTTIAQQLVTTGGGIGISGSPYLRMYGLTKSGQAGALRINWRR